jgi:hypothetical protein
MTFFMGGGTCDDCSWPDPEPPKRYSASDTITGAAWSAAENPEHALSGAMIRALQEVERGLGTTIPVESTRITVTVEVEQ